MARKSNMKLIGAFVLGALAVVIAGILTFGSADYFTPKDKAVLFFTGSLGGLDVGSPVTFRGIGVGSVTGVAIHYDITKQKLLIPVFIEFNPQKFEIVSGARNKNNIAELVQRGLRAQLQVQSFVTGQMSVNFEFYPDAPIRLVDTDVGVQQLPTIPSGTEVLKANVTSMLEKIAELPLEQLSKQILKATEDANRMLTESEGIVKRAGSMVASLQPQVEPLANSAIAASDQVSQMLKEARAGLELSEGKPLQKVNLMLTDARNLINHLNGDITQNLGPAVQALAATSASFHQAMVLIEGAQRFISPDSPFHSQLVRTLIEFKSAARAMGAFAEYYQRHPNTLLLGNQKL
jgi:paraquat-inducible protein B